ncbi:MAG: T9SS type A sorting domain-containing protein [Flavobacteriales bacterium]
MLEEYDMTNAYVKHSFAPSDYPSFTGSKIAMRAEFNGTFRYLHLDNWVWEKIPNCFAPTDVVVDSTSLDAVWATLTPADTLDTEWFVEVVNTTAGDIPTGVATDTVTTTSFMIDGLDHSSSYDIYMLTNCVEILSAWSEGDYSFQTKCAPIAETFEGFEPYTNEMPICWDNIVEAANTFATAQVINSSFNAYEGTKSLRFYNSNDAAAELIAITPELDSIPDYYMTFYSRTSFGNQSVQIGYVTDESDASSFVMVEEFALTNSYQQFAFVPSQEPMFQGARVAFRAVMEGTFDYVYIDNWEWVPFPDCATPIAVSGENILDVTASINWTNLSTTSAWGLELVNITNGDAFTGTATDAATAHPYTFTGLTPNTTYAVAVKADCDTTWSDPFVFTTLIANDIEVSNFVSPTSQGCMLTGAEIATISINNYGGQDATNFDVYYSFDGSTYTLDGTYSDTIAGNTSGEYTLATSFDFQTAFDTTLYVAVSLAGDTVNTANDTNMISVTNLGDQLGVFTVNTGNYATEPFWAISDSVSGLVVLEHTSSLPSDGEYSNYSTYTYDVCFYTGGTYHIEAWDSYGDGWNGGTYSLSQCGGIVIANNGGNEVTTPPSNFNANQLEAEEFFTVEECDDYDLGALAVSGIDEACGMSASEQGYLLIQNYGLVDITAASNVSINYQLNGTGWNTLTTISDMASGSDSLIALPIIDMSTPGVFTFEFAIIYADDENADNDSLALELQSIGQYTEVNQDFEAGPGGWTSELELGVASSWEHGTPTTPLISATADGDAWVTKLDANMNLNETSFLVSPCFDFSTYTEDVEVNFDFIWTSFTHSVRFQTSTDGGATWIGGNFGGTTMPTNTTEWTNFSDLLPNLTGESNVKFRFRFQTSFSNTAEGFGMDNFNVFEHVPYTDASLMDLTTNGVTVPGFDPAVFSYSVEVPFGSTAVPVVGATANAPYYESLTITQAPTLADAATVYVVAEDTNYNATYTVTFYEGPAEQIATLDDLTIDGVTVPGFLSNDFEYTVVLPYGSAIPVVDTVLTSNLSTATIEQAEAPLTDTAFVVVTAQDVSVQNTYTVIFMEEDPATVSTLDMIFVGSDQVPGFTPLTYDYTVYVDVNLTTVGVFGQLTDGNGTITYSEDQPMAVPGSVTLTVVAEDGVTTTLYTVNVQHFQSTDALLTDISLDGTTITGFSSTTYEYTETIPFGAALPAVTYTTSDANATVVEATGTAGVVPTTLTVTAEDGTTELVYTINWEVEAANDNSLLATLEVDFGLLHQTGSLLGFDPLVFNYQVHMCDSAFENFIPTLTYTLQESTSSDVEASWTGYGSTAFITVTAQDNSESIYSIELIDCIGLEEIEAGMIDIYPNPSNGLVNLSVDASISTYNVEVYNAIGQVVYSENFSELAENNLDLSHLADGIYQVKIQDTKSGKAYQTKLSIAK